MSDQIIKSNKQDWEELEYGEKFKHRRKNLTAHFTDNQMVFSIYEVPPGKAVWPYHYHLTNEEIFFILEGKGELRLNDEKYEVEAGDMIRFKNSEEGAHQLYNHTDQPLKYIDVGTARIPDVVYYPDSEKLAVFDKAAPGQKKVKNPFREIYDRNAQKGYFEGE